MINKSNYRNELVWTGKKIEQPITSKKKKKTLVSRWSIWLVRPHCFPDISYGTSWENFHKTAFIFGGHFCSSHHMYDWSGRGLPAVFLSLSQALGILRKTEHDDTDYLYLIPCVFKVFQPNRFVWISITYKSEIKRNALKCITRIYVYYKNFPFIRKEFVPPLLHLMFGNPKIKMNWLLPNTRIYVKCPAYVLVMFKGEVS